MKPYTPRQRSILVFVRDYLREHGVAPTLEEIGRSFGVHRVTIFQHMNALERRGAVRRHPTLARAIEILDPDYQPDTGVQILGRIAAGAPIEAIEHPEPLLPDDVLPSDGDHYALRVEGDSMIEDAICDGDLVVVRRTNRARNGDVVVAVLPGGDATLKRFRPLKGGRVRLEPANARLEPIEVDAVEIRGVVTAVVRQL